MIQVNQPPWDTCAHSLGYKLYRDLPPGGRASMFSLDRLAITDIYWNIGNIFEEFPMVTVALQKPRRLFEETRRIPENPREPPNILPESNRIPRNPMILAPQNPHESLRAPRNPMESPRIPWNPQEPPWIPRNPKKFSRMLKNPGSPQESSFYIFGNLIHKFRSVKALAHGQILDEWHIFSSILL